MGECMLTACPNKKTLKNEAIKEFAIALKERIKQTIYAYMNNNCGGYYFAEDVLNDVDALVKELVEDS